MADTGKQNVRERVWVEKIDHSGDEPVVVETVFTETHRQVNASSTGDDKDRS